MKTNRVTLFANVIDTLCSLDVSLNHFTEAGKAMLYFSSLYDWSDVLVESVLDYPQESSANRKERIQLHAVDYFGEGKLWEKGLGVLKELEKLHRTSYRHDKLADVLVWKSLSM